jgi:serine/threonine protein kinase
MNKYKYQKYFNKNYIIGGLLCSPDIRLENIEEMKAKIEFFGNEKDGFSKINEENIIKFLFEKKDGSESETKDEDKYIFLGKGSSGEVYKGKGANLSPDGSVISNFDIAIKKLVNLNENQKKSLCSELLTISNLNHINIIKYYGYAEVENIVYIFMEFIEGDNLYDYIVNTNNDEKISEKNNIAVQLINGLYYMNQNGVFHRDIKPENIMISYDKDNNPMPKYIDFGFSCKLDLTCQSIRFEQGSPYLLSPEFAIEIKYKEKNEETRRELLPFIDMWALGVTLFSLYARMYLIDSKNPREIISKIRSVTQYKVDEKINKYLKDGLADSPPQSIKNSIIDLLKVNHLDRKITLL